jgi:putative endonuclease
MAARDIGSQWEDAALARLQAANLRLLERNFHCRYGEIDLILSDSDAVVFAEVRYRSADARGDGTVSVGAAKRAKLVRAAQIWLQQNPRHASQPCRFDVVGCSGTLSAPRFEWTRNAFDACFDEAR